MFGIDSCGDYFMINNGEGICVNKQQVEDQLKANKTVRYHFDKNYPQDNKKIKRCDDNGSGYI